MAFICAWVCQCFDTCRQCYIQFFFSRFMLLFTVRVPCVRIHTKKIKFAHTRYRALGPELIPMYRQSARRWLSHSPAVGCQFFSPGLRSPSQPKNVTVLWPVPSYTAWWQRYVAVNNLPKVVTQLTPRANLTHNLLIASPTPYCYATALPIHNI